MCGGGEKGSSSRTVENIKLKLCGQEPSSIKTLEHGHGEKKSALKACFCFSASLVGEGKESWKRRGKEKRIVGACTIIFFRSPKQCFLVNSGVGPDGDTGTGMGCNSQSGSAGASCRCNQAKASGR